MSKQHTGRLIDRFALADGQLNIRAQLDNGSVIDVRVPNEQEDAARNLWGGGTVPFTYRGGRAVFGRVEQDFEENA